MTPTDEEIDALWNRLIGSRSNPSVLEIDAGNMLLALKARAEAAEKERDMLKAALERRGEVVFGREGD